MERITESKFASINVFIQEVFIVLDITCQYNLYGAVSAVYAIDKQDKSMIYRVVHSRLLDGELFNQHQRIVSQYRALAAQCFALEPLPYVYKNSVQSQLLNRSSLPQSILGGDIQGG